MTKEEIEACLDVVPCVTRLFPARVWAVQLVSDNELDELLDSGVLNEIPGVTEQSRFVRGWRFRKETILWKSTNSLDKRTWQEQFLEDFRVFGLREAIGYMADYEFTLPVAGLLVQNGISAYHAIARLYGSSEALIARSKDPLVRALNEFLDVQGEGSMQKLETAAKASGHRPTLKKKLFGSPRRKKPATRRPTGARKKKAARKAGSR